MTAPRATESTAREVPSASTGTAAAPGAGVGTAAAPAASTATASYAGVGTAAGIAAAAGTGAGAAPGAARALAVLTDLHAEQRDPAGPAEGPPGPEAPAGAVASAAGRDGGRDRDRTGRSDAGEDRTGPAAAAPARPGSRCGEDAAEGRGEGATRSTAVPRDAAPAARRGVGDPVKVLMHRHRELCERAVDPLEIAAGLEAHGVTDRTAARFRHRDVFALAEEMYARVPRGTEHTPVPVRPARAADSRAGRAGSAPWILRALLPGAVCALAVAGMEAAEGTPRLLTGTAGAVAVAVTVALCLRRGPLRAKGRTVPSVLMWTLCLLAFAAFGQGLLHEVIGGGPDGAWPMDHAPLAGLALAVAPAACSAHLFSVLARRRLERCRGLDEFAAGARPLLLAVVVLHMGALTVLLALTGLVLPGGSPVPTAALGMLLFLARLLIVHGFPDSAATALAAACAVEAAAPALLLAGRLPGFGALARPVEAVVGAWGTAAVPALACGVAAAGLLAHAVAALSRASAHTP
ncbi:hypothetical protein [Streptomyces peucetius]|uniref:Integral membrane protein n=1 Tax=Streptomyces peucetius TaxID=1950 RepID=A0ABY6IB77_STRPE|nr:hypothetical protein [Streptomyces peucetius]UYQ64256.1 hypothetical protein OGH68_24170 [Streptomyces peucetius]